MNSYYVRRLELEAAFTKMIREGRKSFILPLLRRRLRSPLPLMLSTLHYLDCTTPAKYTQSVTRLVKKLKLDDERFTGTLLYKNIDTSFSGHMVGVGLIERVPDMGSCVRVYFEDGVIRSLETVKDGRQDGAKSVIYDSQGRVSEIILFRDNRVVDAWRYVYDTTTGKRIKKLVVRPGHRPHKEFVYDAAGRCIAENDL